MNFSSRYNIFSWSQKEGGVSIREGANIRGNAVYGKTHKLLYVTGILYELLYEYVNLHTLIPIYLEYLNAEKSVRESQILSQV